MQRWRGGRGCRDGERERMQRWREGGGRVEENSVSRGRRREPVPKGMCEVWRSQDKWTRAHLIWACRVHYYINHSLLKIAVTSSPAQQQTTAL